MKFAPKYTVIDGPGRIWLQPQTDGYPNCVYCSDELIEYIKLCKTASSYPLMEPGTHFKIAMQYRLDDSSQIWRWDNESKWHLMPPSCVRDVAVPMDFYVTDKLNGKFVHTFVDKQLSLPNRMDELAREKKQKFKLLHGTKQSSNEEVMAELKKVREDINEFKKYCVVKECIDINHREWHLNNIKPRDVVIYHFSPTMHETYTCRNNTLSYLVLQNFPTDPVIKIWKGNNKDNSIPHLKLIGHSEYEPSVHFWELCFSLPPVTAPDKKISDYIRGLEELFTTTGDKYPIYQGEQYWVVRLIPAGCTLPSVGVLQGPFKGDYQKIPGFTDGITFWSKKRAEEFIQKTAL